MSTSDRWQQYAEGSKVESPEDIRQRIASQYTLDRPRISEGDYSWRAPTHPVISGRPSRGVSPFSLMGGGGGGGGGGGEVSIIVGGEQDRDRDRDRQAESQDRTQDKRRPGEAGEGRENGGATTGKPPGGKSPGRPPPVPSYGGSRDYDDAPVGQTVGSSAAESVTRPTTSGW
jgi:hypothetical protein